MLMQEIQALLPKYELGMALKYLKKLFINVFKKNTMWMPKTGDKDFGKYHQEAMSEFQKNAVWSLKEKYSKQYNR